MLSLVTILVIIGIVVLARRAKKKKWSYRKTVVFILISTYLIVALFVVLASMLWVIQKNDNGYLQNQVDTLTQRNEQLEEWKKEVNEDLNDKPELLDYVNEYIDKEIDENNKEIVECSRIQKEDVQLYRWLLYFD